MSVVWLVVAPRSNMLREAAVDEKYSTCSSDLDDFDIDSEPLFPTKYRDASVNHDSMKTNDVEVLLLVFPMTRPL